MGTELAQDLRRNDPTKHESLKRDPNQSDLNFLSALARAQVSILEHQHVSSIPIDRITNEAAITVNVAWKTYRRVLEQEANVASGKVSVSPGTRRFTEFADYLDRIRKISDSNPEAVTKEVEKLLSEADTDRRAVDPDSVSAL